MNFIVPRLTYLTLERLTDDPFIHNINDVVTTAVVTSYVSQMRWENESE
jgi:hypothetical protein